MNAQSTHVKTTKTNLTNWNVNKIQFGLYDQKRRELGYQFITYECDFVPAINTNSYHLVPEGHYFVARPHSMRDGSSYGATQCDQYFKTIEEREKWIAARLEWAKKQAEKKSKN